ncbi:MAG: arsenical-resistance protein, partial [Gammaproteobacteria bacterium]|nr:arsenical-resistance protein [Gammaproteobacteria bacterium]
MNVFERYLTVWVLVCIVVGIGSGHLFPGFFQVISVAEIARVNMPVAVLIWIMIIPMLIKIDFSALSKVRAYWRGIGITLFINWAVKPFSMAALAWLFVGVVFNDYLPQEQQS